MNTSTILKKGGVVALLALTAFLVRGQGADDEAIKKTIRSETEAFYALNAEAWEATWLHEANATRTVVANNSYYTIKDWNNFGPAMVNSLKQSKSTPVSLDLTSDNYIIRTDGNLAWVEYDQHMNVANGPASNARFSREYRVLVKQDGGWKIATQITHDPDTFKSSARNNESALNDTGYSLIALKKVKDAIEVLKLNVKLNPNSANCYDSLGEAYALDGDVSKAIKNYEKAIALDPSRESSKAALARLKK